MPRCAHGPGRQSEDRRRQRAAQGRRVLRQGVGEGGRARGESREKGRRALRGRPGEGARLRRTGGRIREQGRRRDRSGCRQGDRRSFPRADRLGARQGRRDAPPRALRTDPRARRDDRCGTCHRAGPDHHRRPTSRPSRRPTVPAEPVVPTPPPTPAADGDAVTTGPGPDHHRLGAGHLRVRTGHHHDARSRPPPPLGPTTPAAPGPTTTDARADHGRTQAPRRPDPAADRAAGDQHRLDRSPTQPLTDRATACLASGVDARAIARRRGAGSRSAAATSSASAATPTAGRNRPRPHSRSGFAGALAATQPRLDTSGAPVRPNPAGVHLVAPGVAVAARWFLRRPSRARTAPRSRAPRAA